MTQTALAIIEKEVRSSEVMTKISNSLGKPATDPSVMKFINGAMMYMQSKVGSKGDVSHCTKQSIIDSLISAATYRLPVDSKHYACLVAYKDVCNFQPEWRGYVAKIKEADASAEITPVLVFKGDKFSYHRKDNNVFYEHIVANPFEDNPKNITGAYCYIKTDTFSDIEVMSITELDAVRASSKAGYAYIWLAWPLEQYRKTILRRGCKRKFTAAVAELDALDNRLFNDTPAKETPKLAAAVPLPKIQEAEVVDGEEERKGEQQEPQLTPEQLLAKTEEARKRKEALEEQERQQGQPESQQDAPGDAQEEAGSTSSDTGLEPGQMMAEGLINAVIAPKGRSSYTKFTLKGVDGKFFATNNPITTEKLKMAKEQGKSVRIIYTEEAWTGGFNQNIVSAEVSSEPVSEERPY